MTSDFRKDLWFSLKIALLSSLGAFAIDGIIRLARVLPHYVKWLLSYC